MKFLAALICLLAAAVPVEKMTFDHTVHDFGTVSIEDGPISCCFTVTNNGTEPSAIYSVATNCRCTKVNWTKELIQPGQSGVINVTYANDEGAKAFDKVLMVYLKDSTSAVKLHVRGISARKKD